MSTESRRATGIVGSVQLVAVDDARVACGVDNESLFHPLCRHRRPHRPFLSLPTAGRWLYRPYLGNSAHVATIAYYVVHQPQIGDVQATWIVEIEELAVTDCKRVSPKLWTLLRRWILHINRDLLDASTNIADRGLRQRSFK
jgi:hypothetical protein